MGEIQRGISLRAAIRVWLDLGGIVERPNKTGELRFLHGSKCVLVNARKKDASARLVTVIRQLQRDQVTPPRYHLEID